MRILAIRGCNLASLAGEFEVDLSRGALADAGVFAIVGPTGAGKSTLLDAMCVALFDRTPRLANRSTVIVGRGDDDPTALGAQDVRSLLRRGASAGWAEVDFESGDDRRYRARWSVRRARGATDGRFQNQQVTLTSIDGGEQLGGTKTETLEAIHQRLGLSFDQFRRSALLAQGEFAAFLRADGKDRSELLERMTGTEIYSKLSVAAHLKAALAEQRLRDRQSAVLAIGVLTDEARGQAEADLVIAKQAQEASRVRLAASQAAARWFAEAERRQRALGEAETDRVARELAVESAAVLRAELALRRRAEGMRPSWDEAARLDRQLAIAQGELSAAHDAATRAEAAHIEIGARRSRLVELHAPVREARIAAGLVERAHRRDATSVEALAVAAAHDASWLLARRDLVAAVASWRDLDSKLALSAALASEIAAADRALDEHARKRDVLSAQRTSATTEHQQANARLADARREAASYQQKRGLSLDAARRQEDEARRRSTELDKLLAITSEARGAATARAELDRQLAELTAAAAADAEQRRAAETERDASALLRDERARHVEDLRKAAGYSHARAELVEGDPCPLCGATEHPWHDRGSFDALIGEAQGRLAEIVARGDAARSVLATVAAREQHRTVERTRVTACLATAEATARASQARWREQLASLGELLFVDDPASGEAQKLATERIEAARGKLEAARAARSHAEAAANAANEAQARVQARQSDVEQHAHKLREIEAAIAQLDVAAERARAERAGKVEREGELLSAIQGALGEWSTGALSEPERRIVEEARDQLTRVTSVGARDQLTRVTSVGARDQLTRVTSVGAREQLTRPTVDETTPATKRKKRGTAANASGAVASSGGTAAKGSGAVEKPGGTPSETFALPSERLVGSDLLAALDRCRRVLADLVAAWARHAEVVVDVDAVLVAVRADVDETARECERRVAAERARKAAATARRDELRGQLSEAVERLEVARTAAGFDREELQRLLSADASRADQLAEQLDTLERAADRARTLVAERRRLVDDHAAMEPADPQARDDARRVDELAAAVDAADHHAAALAAALAADGDARARRIAAQNELLAAEHAAEIDRVLGGVIGSHDGKLFRSFAQSLTLDGLLAVANAHLEELAPRYQLERVPKHDLELQVIDRDLGDEIRGVQSLSGGESFLVSLALALGLSSMSAHDVRVRTLLIDEGFGTLDPATLDSALAVLDALQATGRQVGVISHVPALVERVRAHVRVSPKGGGRSEVVIAEA